MHAYFYIESIHLWLDRTRTQQKATNTTSIDRLVVASYCGFTIFLTSMALIVHAISIVATTPLATISLLLLLSNRPSQTLKHTYL
jgi:Fe2+ transport system protein B